MKMPGHLHVILGAGLRTASGALFGGCAASSNPIGDAILFIFVQFPSWVENRSFSTANRRERHKPRFASNGGAGQVQGEPCRGGSGGREAAPDISARDLHLQVPDKSKE